MEWGRALAPTRTANPDGHVLLSVPFNALRIKAAAARPGLIGEVNNTEDLLRCAPEGDPVRVGQHEIGLAVTLYALVFFFKIGAAPA